MNTDTENRLCQWFDSVMQCIDSDCDTPLDKLNVYYDAEQLFTEKSQDENVFEHPVYSTFKSDFDRLFEAVDACPESAYECYDKLREMANGKVCESFIESMEAGLINPQDL